MRIAGAPSIGRGPGIAGVIRKQHLAPASGPVLHVPLYGPRRRDEEDDVERLICSINVVIERSVLARVREAVDAEEAAKIAEDLRASPVPDDPDLHRSSNSFDVAQSLVPVSSCLKLRVSGNR